MARPLVSPDGAGLSGLCPNVAYLAKERLSHERHHTHRASGPKAQISTLARCTGADSDLGSCSDWVCGNNALHILPLIYGLADDAVH